MVYPRDNSVKLMIGVVVGTIIALAVGVTLYQTTRNKSQGELRARAADPCEAYTKSGVVNSSGTIQSLDIDRFTMAQDAGVTKIVVVCANAKFTKQLGGSYSYVDLKVGDKVSVVGFYGDATKTTILSHIVRDTSVSKKPEIKENLKTKIPEIKTTIKEKVQARITPRSTKYSNLSATLGPNSANYSFIYTGSPAPMFFIATSGDPQMLTGAYVRFARGSSSPISLNNPTTVWDGYACGRTLYWAVTTEDGPPFWSNYNRELMSPIASSVVTCP